MVDKAIAFWFAVIYRDTFKCLPTNTKIRACGISNSIQSNIFLMKNYWHSFSRAAKSAGPTLTYQVSAHNLKQKRMLWWIDPMQVQLWQEAVKNMMRVPVIAVCDKCCSSIRFKVDCRVFSFSLRARQRTSVYPPSAGCLNDCCTVEKYTFYKKALRDWNKSVYSFLFIRWKRQQ